MFTFYSKYFVKALLRISDAVSIRIKIDQVKELLPVPKGILEVRDPAFDYLQSRKLNVINGCSSKPKIDSFTASSSLKIAINLRPLWEKYNFDENVSCEQVEEKYLAALAAAMDGITKTTWPKAVILFLPNEHRSVWYVRLKYCLPIGE